MSNDTEAIKAALRAWQENSVNRVLKKASERRPAFETTAGVEIERLYTPVDGAGEPYLTYAFVQLAEGKYLKDKMELVVRVWQFATPEEAFGGYSYEVSRGAEKPEQLGHASASAESELWVLHGDAFIHIADYGQDPAPRDAVNGAAAVVGLRPHIGNYVGHAGP